MFPLLLVLWIVGILVLIAGWVDGEVDNRKRQRTICGPLAALLTTGGVAAIAYLAGSLNSLNLTSQLSGTANQFTQALEDAIDRGETEAAHQELRRYNAESIDTYEFGTALRQFQRPTDRLNALSEDKDSTDAAAD